MVETLHSFDTLFSKLPVGVYRTTPDGKFLMANQYLIDMLGFSSFDELKNRNLEKDGFRHMDDRKGFEKKLKKEGEITGYEAIWLRKNYTIIHVRETAWSVRDNNEKVLYYEGIVADITQYKFDEIEMKNQIVHLKNLLEERTEELKKAKRLLLRESRSRRKTEAQIMKEFNQYQALVENTSDWIWEINNDYLYTYSSPNIEEILGYSRQKITQKTPFDLIIPEEKEYVRNYFDNIAKARIPFKNFFNTLKHKNGKLVYMETSGVPIFDANENLTGYRGIDRDITEQHLALQALKKTEQKLSMNIRQMPIGYIEWDLNKEVVDWNPVASKIFGFTKTEALREKIFDKIILTMSF